MATYDLEEQEQLDELKTWWKMHGNLVTAVLLAAAIGVVGWQGWNWWQRSQAGQASQLYAGLQQAATQQDAKRARQLAGELIDKHGGTAYAAMGALLSVRTLTETGDAKSAQAQLAWAADNARDEALRDLARLRLATVLADEKSYDEALRRLAVAPAPTFAARYAELKGDVLLAQGKPAEAHAAYGEALEKLKARGAGETATAYRDILQAKHEATGGRS